jgi:hypothetical protein
MDESVQDVACRQIIAAARAAKPAAYALRESGKLHRRSRREHREHGETLFEISNLKLFEISNLKLFI